MNRGEIVETTTAEALAAGDVTNPYTQQLLRSNRGFDPSGAELDLLDAAPAR
jgi:peptide/nickel transport system ATP-binding protein